MFRLTKLFFPAAWVVVLIFLQLDAHAQVPDYVPADGLIAAFGMNNEVQSAIAPFYTATNADSLSYSFDRNGNPAGAFYPNGSESATGASLATDSSIDSVESLTVSFWVKLDSNVQGDRDHFIEKRNVNAGLIHFILSQGDEGLYAYYGSNNDSLHVTQILLPVGVWTHVAWTYWADSEASISTIFTNGGSSDMDTQLFSGVLSSTNEDTFRVGGGLHPAYTVSGSMDELYIWSRALDSDEIVELYLEGAELQTGCTDESACNYDSNANFDDGSCEYLSCILGCTIPTACNYNPLSEFEDGSCTYAEEGYDCDGNCLNDVDDDGICDGNEVAGCEDPNACNYSSNATETGTCVYATHPCDTCSGPSDGTGFVVDGDTDGDDVCDIDEIIGCQDVEACNYNSSATDSDTCVFATDCDSCSGETDGTGIVVDGDGDDNGICDADEGCSDSASCNFDVNGTGTGNCIYPVDCETCSGETDGTGTILPGQDTDNDGVCDADEIPGCTNELAENYNDSATDDDGSCYFSPDWTVVPTPASGMVLGHITVDAIAASEEDWIGAFTPDAVCAGATQPIVQDGLAYISLVVYGDDALTEGVSEGMNEGEDFTLQFFDASANVSYLYHEENGQWLMSGWTNTNGTPLPDYDDPSREFAFTSIPYEPECGDPVACNYQVGGLDPSACEYPEAGLDCDGNCLVDEDNDNVCDGVDPCVGQLDACGICNGPGEIYACGCTEIPEGDCDCDGNQLDECGVCGGTGIPEGDCDCDGSQLDALGDCGGSCAADSDNDGICDDVDPCIGALDACGVCNGPGAIYECGCAELPSSDCNCDGDQLDALGVCGGACAADSDSDGICDDVDPCVGQYDECGVCNGTGPVTGYDCDGICLEDCDADGVCDEYEVSGCVYESACNYNSAATDDDGSCTYPAPGEDCSGNCLFDVDDDQICDQDEITGCQDDSACNYDATATDAGYCDYPETNYDCDGNCLNDSDQDGICDAFELEGCTTPSACNFNAAATEADGSCTFAEAGYDCDGNCLIDLDNDGICDLTQTVGCLDSSGCNYDATATEAGYCDYPETNYDCDGNCLNDADQDGTCDAFEVDGCTDSSACNYDSDATDDDASCTHANAGYDCDGNCLVDSDNDQICDQDEITGCQDDTACNYDATATDAGYCDFPETNYDCDGNCLNDSDQDGICDEFEVNGCTDSTACNYDSTATDDDASCTYATAGFDCDGNCLIDSDQDQICDQDEVTGCQDDTACNYDATATDAGYCDFPEANYDCDGNCLNDSDQDGICDALETDGCTDSSACNYDSDASDDDASCTYATAGYDCDGNCLIDSDNDGICDQNEILGCTDPNAEAFSFQPLATEDDGSCIYCNIEIQLDVVTGDYNESGNGYAGVSIIYGYPPFSYYWIGPAGFESNDEDIFGLSSGNYTLYAVDNLGCEAVLSLDIIDYGCDDSEACNYNPAVSGGGSCDYPETNYDCDGNCLIDADEDGVCDEFEVVGCTDCEACNFNESATDNDGSCSFAPSGYDCNGNCLIDSDNDQICDQDEITGCQDASACNYDATATDAGYCDYPETNYDCDGNCMNDSDQDGICDEFEASRLHR